MKKIFCENIQTLINEWGSVSDDNRKIAKFIFNIIIDDISKGGDNKRKISDTLNVVMNENEIEVTLPSFKDVQYKKINVRYTIYETNNKEETDFILKKLGYAANCSWDEQTQTMNIVSALENGKPCDDFLESIIHESNHLFEYSIGMKTNADRYDKMVNIVKKKRGDVEYYIALALYYTFKHERASYTQQFYQFLLNKKTLDKDFDDIIEEFKPWHYFDNVLTATDNFYDNQYAMKTINLLGYTRKNYYKKLYYAYEKFYQKLKNVYDRRMFEIQKENIKNESLIKYSVDKIFGQIELSEGKDFLEKMENKLPFDTEYFFKF